MRVLVFVAALIACKQDKPAPPVLIAPTQTQKQTSTPKVGSTVTPGSLAHTRRTSYGVAVPVDSDVSALEHLARTKGPRLEVTRESLADMFDDDQLTYLTKGLSQSDADALRGVVAVLRIRAPGGGGMKLARELAETTRDVADAARGWVLDPETFRIQQAVAFHEHVPGDRPDVRKLIVVHSVVGGNELPFLDTAGLRRYGIPELYISEAAHGQINPMTHLLNGAAHTLLDGGDVNARGELAIDFHTLGWDVDIIGAGTGKALVQARWAKERDADDDADLVVELVPPGGPGPEGWAKLIDECFGFEPETLTYSAANDPELMAAAAKARAELGTLRSHFATGVSPGERLTIKAKFTGDEGEVEWMWVDVVAFKGTTFEGTLANVPELIESMRDGQKVKVELADVGDYIHQKKDGVRAGGYSIEVFNARRKR